MKIIIRIACFWKIATRQIMSSGKKQKKHVPIAFEDEGDQSASSNPKRPKFEPENYKQVMDNIRIMRYLNKAPVDTMGCEKCFEEGTEEKNKRFQILVSLMMSSQTKDEVTFAASQRLKTVGFNPETLAKIDTVKLEQLLIPVGFYKNKAKYIKKTSQILLDQYDGDIPNTFELMMKLPGVGPKMSHICMSAAWGVVSGIGVDVHVHRISNRLGWVSKPTKDPEKTRMELESWVPRELWSEVNLLLVGFGQTICSPRNPKCASCMNQKLCPSAFKEVSPKKASPKKAAAKK